VRDTSSRGCGAIPRLAAKLPFVGLASGPKSHILRNNVGVLMMTQFEYKVVPAPLRGEKVRGAKTTADRFALALTMVMNDLGRDGWEYLRADTLPCEERVGFTGKQTSFQNMLVFKREIVLVDAVSTTMVALPAPAPAPVMVAVPPDAPMPVAPPVAWPVDGTAPRLGPARVAAE
jgi:hypothetical protein